MNDPLGPLHKALRSAIVAKMTGTYTSPGSRVVVDAEEGVTPMPYVTMGNDSATSFPTKTTEGADCTHTVVCWARKYSEAVALADVVVQAATDRDATLAVTGFTTARADLDFRGAALRDDLPGDTEGVMYGIPLRFRYWLVQN